MARPDRRSAGKHRTKATSEETAPRNARDAQQHGTRSPHAHTGRPRAGSHVGPQIKCQAVETEVASSTPAHRGGVRLESNYTEKTGNSTDMWRSNDALLNNQRVNEEIKREINSTLRQKKMEIQHTNAYLM